MIKYIRRSRTKGWRLDNECKRLGIKREDVVFCGRGSKWGNSAKIGDCIDATWCDDREGWDQDGTLYLRYAKNKEDLVDGYWSYLGWKALDDEIKKALKGKTLMCWCSLDDFNNDLCHCSVLWKIANEKKGRNDT